MASTSCREVTGTPATAVVVISGVTRLAAATTLRALELGAVDFILKYTPGAPVSRASLRREIVSKVKIAAARATRWPRPPSRGDRTVRAAPTPAARSPLRQGRRHAKTRPVWWCIGASTGGPRAISERASRSSRPTSRCPCIVVQHLPATFTQAFAVAAVAAHAAARARSPNTGARLEPGLILVAPGSMHLVVRADGRVHLQTPAPKDVYRPSIDLAMTLRRRRLRRVARSASCSPDPATTAPRA